MFPSDQTVCLCMIVKNEASVIRRCLESVRPLLDHWVIVDTGSNDGTQDIVRETFHDLPGTLYQRPWCDFATNRTEALALARPHGDYTLIIDADDVLEIPIGFRMPALDAGSYTIDIDFDGVLYRRPALLNAALPWRYIGVLHEFLDCDSPQSSGHLPFVLRITSDGARRNDPHTYRNDAALLEAALAGETDPFLRSRYTFYLAQSYRDCHESRKAIEFYLRRAEMGFWIEEIFVSLSQAGRIKLNLGDDPEEVLALYRRASEACPTRAEALHDASRLCRTLGLFERGYVFAKEAIAIARPPDGLFTERWIYDYGAFDEYSVNAYWAGHYWESLDGSLRALAGGQVPDADRPRIFDNARFALDRLRNEDREPLPHPPHHVCS